MDDNFKNDISKKKSLLGLLLLIIGGFLIRIYYFPYDIPFEQDVLEFFVYAANTSNFGGIPSEWYLANNGWPLFISIFFYIIPIDSFFDHTYLHRLLSIIISVITVIPLYYFCKKYFNEKIALVGASLFIFNPSVIEHSILGGNEILFTFVIIMALYFMISNKQKTIYVSFILLGILSVIRYEGILLIIPFSVIFFIKSKRNQKNNILKYIILVTCFLSIILPFSIIDIINHDDDGLISHILVNISHVDQNIIQEKNTGKDIDDSTDLGDWTNNVSEGRTSKFLLNGLENFVKLFLIILFPVSLFLIPYGIFKIFRKISYEKLLIISVGITLLIPAFYAFSRDFQDIKYLIPLIPIFTMLSLYAVEKINQKIKNSMIFNLTIIVVIIVSSFIVVNMEDINSEHDRESFRIAQKVVQLSNGYLAYHPESTQIKAAEVEKFWKTEFKSDINGHLERQTPRFDYKGFDSLEIMLLEYEKDGLTHIVIDQNENRPDFLKHVFKNEKEYPFLIKEYDSDYDKMEYNVKIFKIDYDILRNFKE